MGSVLSALAVLGVFGWCMYEMGRCAGQDEGYRDRDKQFLN